MELKDYVLNSAAIATVIWIAFQIVKNALWPAASKNPMPDSQTRFLPLLAVAVGIAVTALAVYGEVGNFDSTGVNVAAVIFYGILNGASASGIQELQKPIVSGARSVLPGGQLFSLLQRAL